MGILYGMQAAVNAAEEARLQKDTMEALGVPMFDLTKLKK
jgi:hypothetical protein